MEIQEQIIFAIENLKVISISYKNGERIIEPFTLGCHKTTGNLILRAFFLRGYSSSGKYNDWKIYRIDSIDSIQILDEVFSTDRDGYNPEDSDMEEIVTTAK